MRKYRKWREIVVEQLAADWDAAFDYIQFAIEEYQVDGIPQCFCLPSERLWNLKGVLLSLAKKPA